ncbi:MAG: hypothetical protein ACM3ZQ_11065 [Bacillota bacterium]
MSSDLAIWLAAICTIACYSFLWKENRFFRIAEHLFVGLGAGYAIVMGFDNVLNKAWKPMIEKGDIKLIIPMLLGVLVFARFIKGYNWVTRIPMALLIGMGTALALRGTIQAEFVDQIRATVIPLTSLNNILVVLGTLGTLIYFFFSQKHNVVTDYGSRFGRWVMMASFGAAFGNAVMGRISLLIARLQVLFGDWIHLIK